MTNEPNTANRYPDPLYTGGGRTMAVHEAVTLRSDIVGSIPSRPTISQNVILRLSKLSFCDTSRLRSRFSW